MSDVYFALPRKLNSRGDARSRGADATDFNGWVTHQRSADSIRNERSGEDDSALTADFFPRRVADHCVGGFRTTPAGAEGAPALVVGTAGAFVARKRDTALSVTSRFLSAEAITDWPGSLIIIIA
jgi:hypothetical protein